MNLEIQITMKHTLSIFTLLLFFTWFSGCQTQNLLPAEDLNIEHSTEFQASKQAWLDFKKATNNSYQFIAAESSWSGLAWETTITVEKGVVTQRHFKYTSTKPLGDDVPKEFLEWTEVGKEVGSHTGTSAAPARTLDEVYSLAQTDWLLKRDHTKTYFEAKNNGILSVCGYVDDYCADDCFVGVRIRSVVGL